MKNFVSLFLVLCVFSVSAQNIDKAKLDQYLEALEANNKAMFSLALLENGQPVYQKSIGYVDTQSKQKANKDTQYRIGSITKVFTATMIFQLIDEGKLSLDTPLSQYYPKVKNADKITISMLLSHRSGIHNFTNDPEYLQYMTQPKSKAEMVSLIEDLPSDFAPNSKADYSNSAYVLLGFITEDITQDTYANQLQQRIARKLGLNRTEFGGTIDVNTNQAKSYSSNADQWSDATVTDMSIPHGAGAIISTPTEVAVFMTNLFTGKLISENSLTKMTELNQGHGRGIFQFPFHDKTAFGHTGGIDGFRSNSGYFEADNLTAVITSNGVNYVLNDIVIGILSIYFGMPFDIPDFDKKAIELDANILGEYEGVFSSKEMPLKITLKVNDGKLTAQATGQGAFILTPYSTSEFRFDSAGIVMLFESEAGKVDFSTFYLKQGGGNFMFTKDWFDWF
jgi:D-alanyl-D-alanine carboxypeptidase